ncbi:MAG: exosortase C-terminal domain/associated protein EpsI [Phycisphaerae bacterium]
MAALLVVACGAGYRVLAAHFARPLDSVRIPTGTLARLPLTIGDWAGRDVPLDDRVIIATDTDDHVNRVYRRSPRESVALFIGYGVNLRDLAPHRPEVCYPGAGWTLDRTQRLDVNTEGVADLAVQLHQFHRGGLATDRVTVLNYYIVDGRYCQDVSLLRSKAWRRSDEPTYVAQVEIVCARTVAADQAALIVQRFAADSAPLIQSLLASAVRDALAAADAEGG